MTEAEFKKTSGNWELNPKTCLQIAKGLSKGIWIVTCAHTGKVLCKGNFECAFSYYSAA